MFPSQCQSLLIVVLPENHKRTPKPTLNKKSQDCSLQKHVCGVLWADDTVQDSFIVQCCLRRVDTTLYIGYFPQHCLSAIRAYIAQVISLCSVGSNRSSQNCRLFSCAELFLDGVWVNSGN